MITGVKCAPKATTHSIQMTLTVLFAWPMQTAKEEI